MSGKGSPLARTSAGNMPTLYGSGFGTGGYGGYSGLGGMGGLGGYGGYGGMGGYGGGFGGYGGNNLASALLAQRLGSMGVGGGMGGGYGFGGGGFGGGGNPLLSALMSRSRLPFDPNATVESRYDPNAPDPSTLPIPGSEKQQ